MVGGKENVSKTTTAGCWRGRAPSPTADGAGVSSAVRWLLLLSKSQIASQPSAKSSILQSQPDPRRAKSKCAGQLAADRQSSIWSAAYVLRSS